MNGRGKVVCVTGASGYIASWIVKLLLLRGYTVRATVRDPSNRKKIEHLLALDGAKERLKLLKADLLEEGSFEQAIQGCDAVFHTASPCSFTATDPQTELIEPAVKGTINVLKTCKRTSSSVKRIILTSSMAAVLFGQHTMDVVDETFFSDPSLCMETKNWYPLAKISAENEAWQFANDNGIDMVVINPGFTIGPYYRFVDVRDVALAHVKALENPAANGRYIMDGRNMTIDEIKEFLLELFPDLFLADTYNESGLTEMRFEVCVEKVKSLGIEFTPLEATLRDTIASLMEKSLL